MRRLNKSVNIDKTVPREFFKNKRVLKMLKHPNKNSITFAEIIRKILSGFFIQ